MRLSPQHVQIVVVAKAPRPGFVKTRLCPPYTPRQAADLAKAALSDTLDVVADLAAQGVIGGAVLALDGDQRLIDVPSCFDVVPQSTGGLDRRLAAAIADAYLIRPMPMLLIGMDTPQLTAELLLDAAETLTADGVDAALGLAVDGGFWALGLHTPDERLLLDIPMSTSWTGRAQQDRLLAFGLRVELLPELCDADDAEGARLVAEQAPGSSFARQLNRYAAGLAS
jgi:glycosyltransferase A (GT-A) superfamily protein (DUF2064 family)